MTVICPMYINQCLLGFELTAAWLGMLEEEDDIYIDCVRLHCWTLLTVSDALRVAWKESTAVFFLVLWTFRAHPHGYAYARYKLRNSRALYLLKLRCRFWTIASYTVTPSNALRCQVVVPNIFWMWKSQPVDIKLPSAKKSSIFMIRKGKWSRIAVLH